jgi:hypothetical protein
MAVDRTATLWVYYWFDRVYRVDPSTLACTPAPYTTSQDAGGGPPFLFSMSFAADQPDAATDTLYAALDNPQFTMQPLRFGTVDLQGPSVTPIGTLQGNDQTYTAIAGRGDGRIFALQVQLGTSPVLMELDPKSGAPLSNETLPPAAANWPVSFASWGGDFYMVGYFGLSTNAIEVAHYSTTTHAFTLVADTPGIDQGSNFIVGAGGSTCAPTQPPK